MAAAAGSVARAEAMEVAVLEAEERAVSPAAAVVVVAMAVV